MQNENTPAEGNDSDQTESESALRGAACSPWIIVEGHCATRTLNGERVAFIEKTPRVKHPTTGEWIGGPKGAGGVGVNDCNGGYQPSRDWADAKLIELGYLLENAKCAGTDASANQTPI